MKLVAYIWSFYILFLSVEPGLKALYLHGTKQNIHYCDKCCLPKENQSQSKGKNPCGKGCTGNCNPLETCNNCLGCTVKPPQALISIVPVFYDDKPFCITQDKLFSNFASDFWQPPRLS